MISLTPSCCFGSLGNQFGPLSPTYCYCSSHHCWCWAAAITAIANAIALLKTSASFVASCNCHCHRARAWPFALCWISWMDEGDLCFYGWAQKVLRFSWEFAFQNGFRKFDWNHWELHQQVFSLEEAGLSFRLVCHTTVAAHLGHLSRCWAWRPPWWPGTKGPSRSFVAYSATLNAP